jgi:predicted oxidoreductase
MSLLPVPPASRPLGNSGMSVSSIAWGMWRFAEGGRTVADAARLVHAALDAGITLLDTADIYGFDGAGGFGDAEALLGEVLATEPALRDRMVLATKGGIRPPLPYDQSPEYLGEAIHASLRRLRTDRIDLWQIHRPDILAHPQEVARTLDDAIAAGKIRSLGVSNFTIAQTDALNGFLGSKLVATQPEIRPGHGDRARPARLVTVGRRAAARPAKRPRQGGRRCAGPGSRRAKCVARNCRLQLADGASSRHRADCRIAARRTNWGGGKRAPCPVDAVRMV